MIIFNLTIIQTIKRPDYVKKINQIKYNMGKRTSLNTTRGQILDRHNNILAGDQVQFDLHIKYILTRYIYPEFLEAKYQRINKIQNSAKQTVHEKQIQQKQQLLKKTIRKIAKFTNQTEQQVENNIQNNINQKIWNLKKHLAWKNHAPRSFSFEEAVPSSDKRLQLTAAMDIAEIYQSYPIVQLETDDALFNAQMEFMDIDDIEILPRNIRVYPYKNIAAHLIGWISMPQPEDIQRLKDNRLSRYLPGDICGRSGTEYVCEPILRGCRGELFHNIDKNLAAKTAAKFGQNVKLTIDIKLQKRIEDYLRSKNNKNNDKPISVVVINVINGEILAMVSLPNYNLNQVREHYNKLINDKSSPMINRAIDKLYPPGSIIKPLILIAGLEEKKITPDAVISCPSEAPPKGWPQCWIFRQHRIGHDNQWANNGRNALRGSCNIYFSKLANRLSSETLQEWLLKFGLGQKSLQLPPYEKVRKIKRNFHQYPGFISSTIPTKANPIGPIKKVDKKFFGIGQSNLRVTVLQTANIMATISRDGLYMPPKLFIDPNSRANAASVSRTLDISKNSLLTVRDGLSAAINEYNGTAYEAFAYNNFHQQQVKVYGKTGSTQKPANAWFAGFAEDSDYNSIAIAIVVEKGQHGSSDAAPLGRNIIQFCIEAGYIGKK